MSKWNTTQAEHLEQNLGMLTHALSKDLPVSEKVTQRLRKARLQALDAQKSPVAVPEYAFAGHPKTNWGFTSNGSMLKIATYLPMAALVLGLFFIADWQSDQRIKDIAKVDSAVLIDQVPFEAYKDDGYVRFLITNGKDLEVVPEDDEDEA